MEQKKQVIFSYLQITNRVQTATGVSICSTLWISREFMRNIRTKVSQAYDGRLDRDVYAMFLDENYLDSKKTLTFGPVVIVTSLQSQICKFNFDVINMIAKKALFEKSNGVGYYFYETTKGYITLDHGKTCVYRRAEIEDLQNRYSTTRYQHKRRCGCD